MEYIVFKSDKEGEDYKRLDPRLRGLLLEVSQWQFEKWAVPITVACITRTTDENAAVNGRAQSAHVLTPGQIYARAVDIRNHDLTVDQQMERRDYIQRWNWKLSTPMMHVIDHDAGSGQHTHININQGYKL